MSHLRPQLPWRPAHRVLDPVVLHHMTPAAFTTVWAPQLLQPFVRKDQHRIGLDHQPRPFVAHPPLLEFLGREQMQEILASGAQ